MGYAPGLVGRGAPAFCRLAGCNPALAAIGMFQRAGLHANFSEPIIDRKGMR